MSTKFFTSYQENTLLKKFAGVFEQSEGLDNVQNIVREITRKQKTQYRYNYLANEQKKIDRLVYQLYGLNDEDVNEVETWFARRYPKLAKYADIKSPKPTLTGLQALSGLEVSPEVALREVLKAQIAAGENEQVEFKSTLRYCLKQKSPQAYVEHSSLKTLAAFLNSTGGSLFLGVQDDGALLGLQPDYGAFKDSNKQDALRKHLDNLLSTYLGNQYARYLHIEFAALDSKEICVVEVKEKAVKPVNLRNKSKNNQEEFYIRRSASTVQLTLREAAQYVKEHWK